MRKIIRLVPFFLFLLILLWGFVNINLQNTTVFNKNYIEDDTLIKSNEEILESTGIDLSVFNEDKNIIKIYSEDNAFKVVINKKIINLNELIIGKVILSTINSIDTVLAYFNNFIDNMAQRGVL